jgi:hypothetical protein
VILTELSTFLKENKEKILSNETTSFKLTVVWLKNILLNKPETNVEKIIHKEIYFAENKLGDFLLIAKSKSGRKLTNALFNFSQSFEQHLLKQWLQNKKPKDFLQ